MTDDHSERDSLFFRDWRLVLILGILAAAALGAVDGLPTLLTFVTIAGAVFVYLWATLR